jgi:hypothetical protein
MDWNSIRIAIPKAGNGVTLQFNKKNVLFASSLFLSLSKADRLLNIITKLQEFCENDKNKEVDPIKWIESTFKASKIEFTIKGRVVSVMNNDWIIDWITIVGEQV